MAALNPDDPDVFVADEGDACDACGRVLSEGELMIAPTGRTYGGVYCSRTCEALWKSMRKGGVRTPAESFVDSVLGPKRGGLNGFEKTCSACGRLISEAEWKRLVLLGFQVIPAWENEPGEVLELRNDACGSTLARLAPFSPEALERGAQHELEHTKSLPIARQIAADHLYEDSMYYEKLEAAGL